MSARTCHCGAPAQGPASKNYPDVCSQWPSCESATVEIIDAIPHAEPGYTTVKIEARNIQKTDKVFDVMGGTHGLISIRHNRRTITVQRRDGYPTSFDPFETITVSRPDQEV